jgi:hypothetical protein
MRAAPAEELQHRFGQSRVAMKLQFMVANGPVSHNAMPDDAGQRTIR